MNILHIKKRLVKTIKIKYNSFKLKVVLDMKYFILFCLFFTAFSQATVGAPYLPFIPPQEAGPFYLNEYKSTPLHYYTSEEDLTKVKILLELGADVHAENAWGKTPLHYARRSKETVQLLIDAGADVNARDINQETPLYFAKTTGVAQTLIDAGADVRARNRDGQTPLDYAETKEIAQVLRRAGGGNAISRFIYRNISNCQVAFQ